MKNESLVFGIRAIIEAILAGKSIDKLFIQKGLQGDLAKELMQLVRKNNITFTYVPIEKLNRLTTKNHQGVVANISPIDFYDLENLVMTVIESGKTPLFLILDQLSAACTDVDGIIIQKKGGAPVNADTIKTSAGAVFNIPICKVDHIKDAMFYLQGSGIQVIAATEKAATNIYDIDLTIPTAIIMGSEDKGISASVLKLVDLQAKLPMYGDIASLNVSVACGVFLYEVTRQRL